MNRRIAACILVLSILMNPLVAQDVPDAGDIQDALSGVAAALMSTFAASTSIPQVTLDGVTVEHLEQDSSTITISYLRCDVSSMASRLERPDVDGRSFLQRMLYSASSHLSPITRLALDVLDSMDLERGDVVLDGTLAFHGPMLENGLGSTLFHLYIMRDWSRVDFDVRISMLVSGRDFATPLAFEGLVSVDGDEDGIVLTTEKMTCNNFLIEMAPMHMGIG